MQAFKQQEKIQYTQLKNKGEKKKKQEHGNMSYD